MFRAAPLVRVKAKFTVRNAVCCRRRRITYGVLYCEFGFDSPEWSRSQVGGRGWPTWTASGRCSSKRVLTMSDQASPSAGITARSTPSLRTMSATWHVPTVQMNGEEKNYKLGPCGRLP